jgi:predicted nuclease with RNAse H fold
VAWTWQKPAQNTGVCALRHDHNAISTVHTMMKYRLHERNRPDLIAIDAPLSLPPGRTSSKRNAEHFRLSDRELMKKAHQVFPSFWGPCVAHWRGIDEEDADPAVIVIEIHPELLRIFSRIPRKQMDW